MFKILPFIVIDSNKIPMFVIFGFNFYFYFFTMNVLVSFDSIPYAHYLSLTYHGMLFQLLG